MDDYNSVYSGEQIDGAVGRALSGGEIDKLLSQKAGKNLLINSYFENPDAIVDQRGGYVTWPEQDYYATASTASSLGKVGGYYKVIYYNENFYTFVKDGTTYYVSAKYVLRGYTSDAAAVHACDGWRIFSGTLVIDDGFVRYISKTNAGNYPRITQLREGTLKAGVQYTVSALVKINQYTGSVVFRPCTNTFGVADVKPANYIIKDADVGEEKVLSVTFVPNTDIKTYGMEFLCVDNTGKASIDIEIRAMQLELGTQQTLAHKDENGKLVLNKIPNYVEELAKCQRYFVRFPLDNTYQTIPVSGVTGIDTNSVRASVATPVPLRANPTVTINGLYVYALNNGTEFYEQITKCDWSQAYGNICRMALNIATASTVNLPIIGLRNKTNTPAYLDLSAEL